MRYEFDEVVRVWILDLYRAGSLSRVKAYISINHPCSLIQISFGTDPISKMCLNFHMQVMKGKCCNLKHIAIEKSVIL